MDLSRYRGLFLAESRDHLSSAREILRGLSPGTEEEDVVTELFRHAHSLKGMAATMGYVEMAATAHALEDVLAEARTGAPLTAEVARRIEDALDSLERQLDDDTSGSRPPASAPQRIVLAPENDARLTAGTLNSLFSRIRELGEILRVTPPLPATDGEPRGDLVVVLRTDVPAPSVRRALTHLEGFELRELRLESATDRPRDERPPADWVRVRADLLDDLLESVLQMMMERDRLETALDHEPGSARRHLERQTFLLKRCYSMLTELRLVPFGSVGPRLVGAVRGLAERLGKQVDLRIEGREIGLDRALLEALVEPLVHLVRNAVDHGVEPPAERETAGKPRRALLSLRLRALADSLLLTLEDDGRGVDAEALRRTAVEQGWIDAAQSVSEEQLLLLLSRPGLSTSQAGEGVSGRGVGLDVVRSKVERMGGRLSLRSTSGRGTIVSITLPAGAAMLQVLMVRAAGELFAVPIAAVKRVVRLGDPDLPGTTMATTLASCLQLVTPEPSGRPGDPVLLFEHETTSHAVIVDEIVGRRDVLVGVLAPALQRLPQYAGAAVLEDGRVALVLDPQGLLLR